MTPTQMVEDFCDKTEPHRKAIGWTSIAIGMAVFAVLLIVATNRNTLEHNKAKINSTNSIIEKSVLLNSNGEPARFTLSVKDNKGLDVPVKVTVWFDDTESGIVNATIEREDKPKSGNN